MKCFMETSKANFIFEFHFKYISGCGKVSIELYGAELFLNHVHVRNSFYVLNNSNSIHGSCLKA